MGKADYAGIVFVNLGRPTGMAACSGIGFGDDRFVSKVIVSIFKY